MSLVRAIACFRFAPKALLGEARRLLHLCPRGTLRNDNLSCGKDRPISFKENNIKDLDVGSSLILNRNVVKPVIEATENDDIADL